MNLDWQLDAACKNDPHPDAWFSHGNEQADRNRALRVCFGCPVRTACLEYSLGVERELGDQIHGVAGGLTAPERKRLLGVAV